MAGTPEIEALEADETEEEKTMDELKSALEASRQTGEDKDEPIDEAGKEPPEEVVEEKKEEDPVEKPEEVAEEVLEEKKEEVAAPDPLQENRELRQILREQKREMATMQAKLARVEKGVAETLEEDEKSPLELSRVETLQQEIALVAQQKGPIFETLIEAMEANPKYPDIRDVCTRENFDDIFEELGRAIGEKEGRDPTEVELELESEVWHMGNPYKFMYGIIKEYHPRYATTKEEGKEEPKVPEDKPKGKKEPVKEPPKAPTSIASVGGSDADTKSGWTAKKIDELPEDELGNVPKDTYEKYLRGELD